MRVRGSRLTEVLVGLITGLAVAAVPVLAGGFSQTAKLFAHDGYDYVPSMIFDGDYQHFWWCGGPAPTDVIYYRSIHLPTAQWSPFYVALTPTPGAWDSAYTCDPSVVAGSFSFQGTTYQYAMYYTGTDRLDGMNGGVGVAFSNDKINWVKYPFSIARSSPPTSFYGFGEQAVLSANGGSALWLWVLQKLGETQHYHLYYSPDGLHLQYQCQITENGVDGNFITEADFVYDYNTGTVYMLTDRINDTASIDVYTIPWGSQCNETWVKFGTINRTVTGQNTNHGGGFLRDRFGSNTPWLPTVEVYFGAGASFQEPSPSTWDLWWAISP